MYVVTEYWAEFLVLCSWSLGMWACLLSHLCPNLCNPMNCIPLGSSVQRISQAKILEWAAISFFRGSSQPRNRTNVSCASCIAGGFLTCWVTGEALVVVQLLGRVWFLAMPRTVARRASLSFTVSQWESQSPGRLIRSPGFLRRRKGSGALEEEIGVWNSQEGGKDKSFFLFILYIP